MLFFNFHSMVHDKTGPDRKKLDRRNARQQTIKFKDSGFRTGKMLKKNIKIDTTPPPPPSGFSWAFDPPPWNSNPFRGEGMDIFWNHTLKSFTFWKQAASTMSKKQFCSVIFYINMSPAEITSP